MSARLIIDGNAVYEIDEDCMKKQRKKSGWHRTSEQQKTEEALDENGKQKPFDIR